MGNPHQHHPGQPPRRAQLVRAWLAHGVLRPAGCSSGTNTFVETLEAIPEALDMTGIVTPTA